MIENKSVDYVPENERHGKARSLFTLWFCTNIAPLAVVTGAISTQTYHLNILSAIAAIVAGHLFGGLFLVSRGRASASRRWCRAALSLAATARC
nr:cytosine permease [Candidatus Pantoea persica]MBA2813914.1 Permease for allantoin and cytosine [Candidatus Pantoea persica]